MASTEILFRTGPIFFIVVVGIDTVSSCPGAHRPCRRRHRLRLIKSLGDSPTCAAAAATPSPRREARRLVVLAATVSSTPPRSSSTVSAWLCNSHARPRLCLLHPRASLRELPRARARAPAVVSLAAPARVRRAGGASAQASSRRPRRSCKLVRVHELGKGNALEKYGREYVYTCAHTTIPPQRILCTSPLRALLCASQRARPARRPPAIAAPAASPP